MTSAGFLKEPRVRIDREDDGRRSAFIQLREGVEVQGVVQPNKDVLAFFLIAADGLPVGIRLHGPASGVAVCELMDTLIEGPEGPEGVERNAHHCFFSIDDVRAVLRGFKQSLEELTA